MAEVYYEIDLNLNIPDNIFMESERRYCLFFENRIFNKYNDLDRMNYNLWTETNGDIKIIFYTDKLNYARNGNTLCYTLLVRVNTETDTTEFDKIIYETIIKQVRIIAQLFCESKLEVWETYEREHCELLTVTNLDAINIDYIKKHSISCI